MRFMGIDYGMKRIGVALSDEDGSLAFPKVIILNDSNAYKKIGEILKNNGVDEIVVGESLNFAGGANALASRIEIFMHELKERFNLPVRKQKEFLTTVEARKSGEFKSKPTASGAHSKQKTKKLDKVDASAAALILQRYLDKVNKDK